MPSTQDWIYQHRWTLCGHLPGLVPWGSADLSTGTASLLLPVLTTGQDLTVAGGAFPQRCPPFPQDRCRLHL